MGPVSIVIVVVLVVGCPLIGWRLVDDVRFHRRALRAPGRVVDAVLEVSGGDHDSAASVVERPVVEFTPAGSTGVIRARSPRPVARGRLPVGSEVSVLYDPARRHHIAVEELGQRSASRTAWWGAAFVAGCAVILAVTSHWGL